jgi:hypothetical protein
MTSRIANALSLVAVLGLIAFLMTGNANWPSRPAREVPATFKSALFDAQKSKPKMLIQMQVELSDGRTVPAWSTIGIAPQPGARIILREHANILGAAWLYWDGIAQDPAPDPTRDQPQ